MRISDWSSDVCSSDLKHKTGGTSAYRPSNRQKARRVLFGSGFRGGSLGVFSLLGLLGGAFLGLLARLALVRVVAGFALGNTGFGEEAQDAVGRLGALGDPFLDALDVQLDALVIVLEIGRASCGSRVC